ncbi:MAG TPA: helix-turn-helix domain-containing protein [Patescibacteria group bacterium]|nr:helix-turn-helix domain-containing protein [Patescibacteria group bacterium]
MDRQNYLTVQDVSNMLQLSVLTIYKYIKEGRLEAIEFGGHYRISRVSLEKFINEHKVSNPNSEGDKYEA